MFHGGYWDQSMGPVDHYIVNGQHNHFYGPPEESCLVGEVSVCSTIDNARVLRYT